MSPPPDKAAETPDESEPRRRPTIQHWSSMIDELIQEAIRDGAFDNLPGHGRPLDLRPELFGQDTELAFKLLKDNDFTLPWITDRVETLAQIEALRAEIGRHWQAHRQEQRRARSEEQRAAIEYSWRYNRQMLADRVAALNGRIAAVNLSLPSPRLEIIKLSLERELEKLAEGG